MMLAYRQYFKMLLESGEDFAIFVFMDASPQWRGRELYAASIDLIRYSGDVREVHHMLLPLLNLGSHHRTVAGKTWALLWMLILIVGPEYWSLRGILRRIRSFTTDLGGEFLVRDVKDSLIGFMRAVGARVPRKAVVEDWLFPMCLAAVGWHHCMDGLLRFGLLQLRWFGKFMDRTKGITRWLRNARDDIADALCANGRRGAGALVRKTHVPRFAEWRWKTLALVLEALSNCLPALLMASDIFIQQMVGCGKDRVLADRVRQCLCDPTFPVQYEFVHWFASWVTKLQQWGSSCPCPEHKGQRGVVCNRRGRLIHLAFAHASDAFRCALEELQEWRDGRFGGDIQFQHEVVSAVRATAARSLLKLHFLDKLPYILALLDSSQPATAARALAQFAEAPLGNHHRLTLHFLGPDSTIRQHIESLASGNGMHPALQREVDWLREIPIDDSIAESPHACARRYELHSRAATFGWHASSQRLQQNLRDVQIILPRQPFGLQWLWDEYMRVPNMAHPERRRHISRRALERRIYHLHGALPEGWAENFVCMGEEGDDGDGPPGAPRPADGDAAAKLPLHAVQFREWLLQALAPSMVASVRSEAGELVLFEVLELPRRLITVKTYDHDHASSSLWSVHDLVAMYLCSASHVFS